MTIYKCLACDFEALEKQIKRIAKKLDKHNLNWKFEKLNTSIEKINIYEQVGNEMIHSTIPAEVVNYTFEMEQLKIGDYRAVAVIDHTSLKETKQNMVHTLENNITIDTKYRTIKSNCEHCSSHRSRNKTVLLQDAEGNLKQVGTTCIKEYTGIDAIDVIKAYADITVILIKEINEHRSTGRSYGHYMETSTYLANCINLINQHGYNKEDHTATKHRGYTEKAHSTEDLQLANTIINYFKSKEFADSFKNNIKVALSNEYSKESGFVAYAYVAYKKQLEEDERLKQEQAEKAISKHIGTIGKRMDLKLKYDKSFSFDTMYGTKYIHLFKDAEGNIFKWATTKHMYDVIDLEGLGYDDKEASKKLKSILTLKATIKDHIEYNEELQTELTRCKLL